MSPQDPSERPGWSLAARLTTWCALASFLVVLLATGYLYHALSKNLGEDDTELLESNVQNLRDLQPEPGKAYLAMTAPPGVIALQARSASCRASGSYGPSIAQLFCATPWGSVRPPLVPF